MSGKSLAQARGRGGTRNPACDLLIGQPKERIVGVRSDDCQSPGSITFLDEISPGKIRRF
jgi:hypothetical protein